MPNANTHMVVGAGVSVTATLVEKNKHLISHHIALASLIRALADKLPDIFEPVVRANHTQLFHGVSVFNLLSLILFKAYQSSSKEPLETFVRAFILIGGVVYLSLFSCFASTSKDLPLTAKTSWR